jgi:coproporphyrinogen III oxidase-like Fe-S oxidoreductase
MTTGRAPLDPGDAVDARRWLAELIADGVVEVDDYELRMAPESKPFLRNVAAFFDTYLRAATHDGPVYSRAI